MHRKYLLLFVLFFPLLLNAQVFNTASLHKPGSFSIGLNPVLYEKDLGIFVRGGFGLTKSFDLGIHYGFFEGDDYIGADIEWLIRSTNKLSASLFAGAHTRNHLGIDLGGIASYPLTRQITVFSGVDIDLIFSGNMDHYTWVPLGVEVMFRRNAAFIFEIDVPMSHFAWNIFGGGACFYF